MVLRGQGDSPVRICDPCKKLEEAARYELRYGHKNRAQKGFIFSFAGPFLQLFLRRTTIWVILDTLKYIKLLYTTTTTSNYCIYGKL